MKIGLNKIFWFLKVALKGIAQIMLQENSLTGLLFLVGIGLNSIALALAALLGSIIGSTTAILLGYPTKNLEAGLYGFSAALTGVAILLFFENSVVIWLTLVIGATAATILQNFFLNRNIPVYTLPFVVVTWILFLVLSYFTHTTSPNAAEPFALNHLTVDFILNSFGQVILQANSYSGLLFLLGILINSPLAGFYSILAATIASLLAALLSTSYNDINTGIYGFNAILCALVFTGTKISNVIWAVVATILSVFIMFAMQSFQLPALTFPFVAATVIALYLKSRLTLWIKG